MAAAEYIWQLHCQDHGVYYDGTVYPALKTTDGTPPAEVCPVNAPDTIDMPIKLMKITGTTLAPTSNLDLTEGSITLPSGTSFPASPVEGDLFYRTDEDKTYIYDGSGWNEAGKGTPHGDLADIGSNTHAQVDSHVGSSANPHTVTKTQVGLTNVEDLKVNLAASVAPTANDDSGSGYAVGSRWINTSTDQEYVCSDATPTAAVWTETTGGGSTTDVYVSRTSGEGDLANFSAGFPDIYPPLYDSGDNESYIETEATASSDKGGIVQYVAVPDGTTGLNNVKVTGKLSNVSDTAINVRVFDTGGTQIANGSITSVSKTTLTLSSFSPTPTLTVGSLIRIEIEGNVGTIGNSAFIGSTVVQFDR